jgi:4-diphosphocytidyl-2-C-methyl-D-erythritol kinase
MDETAFAKINLALHVRGRMTDGYHRIETVFAFAEHGDRIAVLESDDLELEVTGPFAAQLSGEADNIMLRAAHALREQHDVKRGARLILEKNLPVAAGLGGGSADAAATLRLLTRRWSLGLDERALLPIATTLGADVPACLLGGLVRGDGRGDDLTLLDPEETLLGKPMLLVNPGEYLPTDAVYRRWDGMDRGPLEDWRSGRNDLEPAAIGLVPEIADVLAALGGAELARMSGSGATCFGLYSGEAQRDAAAAAISAAFPRWWIMATRLASPPPL